MKAINAPDSNHDQTPNVFSLGFSTCPNDTFMFDALVNGKIDSGGLSFNVHLADIETLNQLAIKGELDITKISFGVYSQIQDTYELLTAGSALGKGVGPLFISKKEFLNPLKEKFNSGICGSANLNCKGLPSFAYLSINGPPG